MQAIDLYAEADDWRGIARTALLAVGDFGETRVPWDRHLAVTDRALEAPGERDDCLEASLLATRALNRLVPSDLRRQHIEDAHQLAAAASCADATLTTAAAEAQPAYQEWRFHDAIPLWDEVVRSYENLSAPIFALRARLAQISAIHVLGDLSETDAAYGAALREARRTRSLSDEQTILLNLAAIATMRGDVTRAQQLREQVPPGTNYLWEVLQEYAAEVVELPRMLPDPSIARGITMLVGQVHGVRARAHFLFGDREEARREVETMVSSVREHLERPIIALNLVIGGPAILELADEAWPSRWTSRPA